MPGRLEFATTADGASSATTRMVIDNAGAVTLGTTSGTGAGALYAGAGTFTALLTTETSSAGAGAGLRLPHGVAPTTPTNGDIWTTTAGLFVQINGVTKTVTLI